MKQLEDDFKTSLQTISNLRRSSLASILLMIFGIVIVTSSLTISLSKLRSMKELIGYYQNIYGPRESGYNSSSGQKSSYDILYKRLRTAQEQALELVIDTGIDGMPRSRPVLVRAGVPIISSKDIGWVYYGYKYDDGWYRPKFDNSGNENPQSPNSVITTVSEVTIYENYIKFDPVNGWVNAREIAEINPATKLKVLDVHIVLDRYYWVKVKLNDKKIK